MEKVNEELKDMYSTNNSSMKEVLRNELKSALQSMVAAMPEYNADRIQAATLIRSMEAQTTDAEKFFADVVAELEKISIVEKMEIGSSNEASCIQEGTNYGQSAECFEDPITCMLMCDPVKGVDGHTYDRWTIIRRAGELGASRSPFSPDLPFAIAVDDIDVRSRLFAKFPEQQEKFCAERAAYRDEALEEAKNGNFGDAVSMLGHVLQWDPNDKECQKSRNEALLQVEVGQSILKAGESLKAGAAGLRKGNYKLILQGDDNLVIYCEQDESGAITTQYATWSSRTRHKAGGYGHCCLTMRRDGNLVMYDEVSERKVVWETNTAMSARDGDCALHLTETGTLEVRSSSSGGRLWCNEPMSSLRVGESLKAGSFLLKGEYRLAMQRDDNLVLYVLQDGPKERAIWASHTMDLAGGTGSCSLVMQDDGNLVIVDGAGSAVWMSNSRDRAHLQYSLHLRSDGCLDIRRPDGQLRWRHHVGG